MSENANPGELADALEREADDLKKQGDKLGSAVEETRSEWEANKADRHVPGAVPDDEQHQEPEEDDPASFPSKESED
jgi:hypothetical protein